MYTNNKLRTTAAYRSTKPLLKSWSPRARFRSTKEAWAGTKPHTGERIRAHRSIRIEMTGKRRQRRRERRERTAPWCLFSKSIAYLPKTRSLKMGTHSWDRELSRLLVRAKVRIGTESRRKWLRNQPSQILAKLQPHNTLYHKDRGTETTSPRQLKAVLHRKEVN